MKTAYQVVGNQINSSTEVQKTLRNVLLYRIIIIVSEDSVIDEEIWSDNFRFHIRYNSSDPLHLDNLQVGINEIILDGLYLDYLKLPPKIRAYAGKFELLAVYDNLQDEKVMIGSKTDVEIGKNILLHKKK